MLRYRGRRFDSHQRIWVFVIVWLFSRIIDLVSHTTYVVCVNVNFIQFKVDPERQLFWETFHSRFLFTLRVFARNLLRGNRRRNTFCILFRCLAWGSNPGFTSNTLPTRLPWLQWCKCKWLITTKKKKETVNYYTVILEKKKLKINLPRTSPLSVTIFLSNNCLSDIPTQSSAYLFIFQIQSDSTTFFFLTL